MPYVYILRSKRDGRYYIGSAVDVHARLRHHRAGFTHSTARFGGTTLVLVQEYKTLVEARAVEQRLKLMKRHDIIERIVRDGVIRLRASPDVPTEGRESGGRPQRRPSTGRADPS